MNTKATFTPDDEPYLGRESVYHFDQVIISCLELNKKVADFLAKENKITKLQDASKQLIPHAINISLTIRELVRQGYLFGAIVLMRPLIERTAIVNYLDQKPEALKIWEDGWSYDQRPKLIDMLQILSGEGLSLEKTKDIIKLYNHIVHGDPAGAHWSLIEKSEGGFGYSVGRITNNTELCDFICFQTYCYMIVLMGLMTKIFISEQ